VRVSVEPDHLPGLIVGARGSANEHRHSADAGVEAGETRLPYFCDGRGIDATER
jgi:hypothetical protein